jgi:hypothetical protein
MILCCKKRRKPLKAELTLFFSDAWGDSLCCQYGQGFYSGTLNDVQIFSGGENFDELGTKDTHIFTVPLANPDSCTAGCETPAVKFELEILTDRYPGDTSWVIDDQCGREVVSGDNYFGQWTLYGPGHGSHTVLLCEGQRYNFTFYGNVLCDVECMVIMKSAGT